MRRTIPNAVATAMCVAVAAASAAPSCNHSFTETTAHDFVASMNPAWNPGNSLDAVPDETSWGQPLIVPETIANSKALGFRGVRLPVTHSGHFTTDAPGYTLDAKWLDRVEEVVNMILSNDMPVLLDSHHDSSWLDPNQASFNRTILLEKFYKMWFQVAERFACAPSTLAFETINELGGEGAEAASWLTELQRTFIRAINDAGGHNKQRVIVLSGLGDSYAAAIEYFEPPKSCLTNPWALTYHYYGPWDFTALAFGRTTWGNDEDKAAIGGDIRFARGNFSDVALLIGEFAVAYVHTETAARWKWYDFVTRTATEQNTSVAMWNAGGDFKPNWPGSWKDMTTIDIIGNGARGIPNALPDSTVDRSASTHFSSAYVFHRRGDAVSEKVLPFLWNSNTLETVTLNTPSGSRKLVAGSEYEQTADAFVLKEQFVDELFGGDASSCQPGSIGALNLDNNPGATLVLEVYCWDTPSADIDSFTITPDTADEDLFVPIEFNGMKKMATMKVQTVNGDCVVDTWTIWMGPLAQCRATWSYHFDWNDEGVIIKSDILRTVRQLNQTTTFSIELYPRHPDNMANITATVA